MAERPDYEPERREDIRRAARVARAEAGRVQTEAEALLQQTRRLAELIARDGADPDVRTAFRALPVPAALLDSRGVVVAANAAWQAMNRVGAAIAVGEDFPGRWIELTGDTVVAEAAGEVVRTSRPAQAEATVRGVPAHRLAVQLGPAGMQGGRGVLVVLFDITGQYEREQRLLYDATHDPLTGVGNRAWLQREMAEALDRLRRYDERFALLYLDLDGFKAINDRYGHRVGDEILIGVAARWAHVVRAPDLLARVGGDEFVVLVQHAFDLAALEALLARLAAVLEEPVVVDATSVRLSVTIGSVAPPAGSSVEGALALADQAMYARKPRGSGAPG